MDEFCTCGARLPEDARFCHKCGRPVRPEYAEPEEPAVVPPPPPVTIAAAPPSSAISFRNGAAVRTALLAAIITCPLFAIPMPFVLAAIWQLILPLAGGFLSVYLYSRRTGDELTMTGGARMGWLTGIFCFVFFTILFTIVVAVFSNPELRSVIEDNLRNQPSGADALRQLDTILSSPTGALAPVFVLFVVLTTLPAVGGALGAKVLAKE